MAAPAPAPINASSLSLDQIVEAYNVQIAERRSDLEQLQEVRDCMQQAHAATVQEKQAYLVHLNRKMKSRLQRGGDITSYSRIMESYYSNSTSAQEETDQRRPVNVVIRRQSMLLSTMHQCEVQRKLVALTYTQNKTHAERLMKQVSDFEDEKAQLQVVFAKRRQEREQEMQEEKERILTTVINPQRMVMNKLAALLGEVSLEEQMMARRARQSKGIQQTLKTRSENFKKMRQNSFERAKHHRRKSIGSLSGDGNLAEDTTAFISDDRSVGSNKSGWSAKSGRSALSGWSGRWSGRSNMSGMSTPRGAGILERFFGRTSSTTVTAPSPMMEISIPPSSAFMFMSGLGDELLGDDDLDPAEPIVSSFDS
jgi:hypothetical protein